MTLGTAVFTEDEADPTVPPDGAPLRQSWAVYEKTIRVTKRPENGHVRTATSPQDNLPIEALLWTLWALHAVSGLV